MSVSKQQMDEVRLTGANAAHEADELDWVAVITGFAVQYDMHFSEALRWISSRTSLQVACEIMGIALSPSIASRYTPRDLEILNALGDVLWAHGCNVPRLMEHRRMEYVKKGRDTMGFSLTREEYLRERAAGKSKNKIAKQQGISGPALFHWLNKWGLKDVAVEQKEIELLLKHCALSVEDAATVEPSGTVSASESVAMESLMIESQELAVSQESEAGLATDNDSEEGNASSGNEAPGYVLYPRRKLHVVVKPSYDDEGLPRAEQTRTEPAVSTMAPNNFEMKQESGVLLDTVTDIHIPLPERQGLNSIPEIINTQEMSRDDLMQMGLRLLQEAVGRAYGDLSELLGAGPASHQIHQYVAHQVEKFVKKKG